MDPIKSLKYKVIAPEKIEIEEESITLVPDGYVLVKPLLTGICQSDLRYFFGRRDPEILKKKYPLCLLHEGVAEVVESARNLEKGDRVVIIPNIPCYIHNSDNNKCYSCNNPEIGENYCSDVKFMSSSCDGMSQTYFLQPIDCTAKVSEGVSNESAALTELLTVNYRAIAEAKVRENDKVIVFGCGPTGYLMVALLHFVNKIKKENLYVVDVNQNKLDLVKDFAIPLQIGTDEVPKDNFDVAFDCVGGKNSESSINQSIDALKIKGNLILLGVSESKILINTRSILDKGLIIKGTTRSPRQDYSAVLETLKDAKFQEALSKIICDNRFKADSVEGLVAAFKEADNPEHHGKVLIEWP